METAEGRDLFTLYKAAQPDAPKPVEAPEPPISRGAAHDKMQRLADEHRRANPHLSPARAYVDVYQDRANAELRNQVIAEQLSPRPRAHVARRVDVDMANPDRAAAAQARRTAGP